MITSMKTIRRFVEPLISDDNNILTEKSRADETMLTIMTE